MPLMGSRYIHLVQALAGYEKTGIPLVEFDGNNLIHSCTSDDVGIYYLIPRLATWFGLSLDASISLFFNGILFVSLSLGLIGLFLLYRSFSQRCVAIIGLFPLLYISYRVGDVYIISPALAVAVIPWCLYFIQRNEFSRWFYPFAFCVGAGAGLAHYIRSHSGIAAVLFMFVLIVSKASYTGAKKALLLATMAAGIALSSTYFFVVRQTYITYAKQHLPQYQCDALQHVFWHPVYVGLGFINNEYGIRYDDAVAHKKALSINPSVVYPSQESELILRNEIVALVRKDPWFILNVVGAKIGVLLLYFLLFANLGFLATWFYPLQHSVLAAFASALVFNALSILIAIPLRCYLLGFIACAVLFGVVGINNFLRIKKL